jgi:hypothetical protein
VQVHPSVNQMTKPAKDQSGVAALDLTLTSILCYMFETDCTWEIEWQKIDLSDGFWRIVVEAGENTISYSRCCDGPRTLKTHTCSLCHYRWVGPTAQPISV